ncbi:MAG TPA: GNAT family N-acetyltransferase [Leptospiraceae bacterium]|nr:GNAT family N-acetyltransferase [Leptospiraceae bacterium]HMW04909.1 GNAT family N-acetyltransferase [Leptospiraceae bacterium]HMX33958.1 GNAT family N-acetyltransferase [Leptospiraceae bacterium]HMY30870.1 GNAT family N-acetyltransferase [Leptospiraceae bacterium]HMZ62674.1 GNAT family N-acetyltransferase [Leptospiraceae bacterium]
MNIQIISANLEDLNEVLPLFNLYRDFYEMKPDLNKAESFLRERLQNKDSKIFLAKSENISVGFTQLYPSFSSLSMKPVWILNDLYVLESHRKQGIGKMLLDAAKQFAKETGSKGLTLTTAIQNTTAQSLYEKYGFMRNDHFYEYFLFFNE